MVDEAVRCEPLSGISLSPVWLILDSFECAIVRRSPLWSAIPRDGPMDSFGVSTRGKSTRVSSAFNPGSIIR